MWVDKFVQIVEWTEGIEIWFQIIPSNGRIDIFHGFGSIESSPLCPRHKIDKEGYLYARIRIPQKIIRTMENFTTLHTDSVRVSCLFNTLIEELNQPYILK
jgi:hypothetical protein